MTKMVQLSERAYLQLRNAKRGQESFSEVVLRLTRGEGKPRPTLSGLKGLRSDADREAHRHWLREMKALDMPKE